MDAPSLLAIDTAADRCTLALAHAGAVTLRCGAAGRTHLEHVLPMIEHLLQESGLQPRDCAAFAFGSGPGSFTGLRVACTLVQGLALGSGRPVIGVGHLDALPHAAYAGRAPAGTRVLALLDARMDEAYWACYEAAGDAWLALADPAVGGRAQLQEAIARWRPDAWVGKEAWIRGYIDAGSAEVRAAQVDAAVIAKLALRQLARGAVLAPAQALPLYVRDRVALTVAQRRAAQAGGPA
jgi:tRNA threonylcarbamoyladenosine biosynthesis protein TsaB